MMPGKVIPFQSNSGNRYKSTGDLINSPIQIKINPDGNGYAEGSLFIDQGISKAELKNN